MGKRIESLMQAVHAAGYAMAPEDIYAAEDVMERLVMKPAQSTALVPYTAASPAADGFMAHLRSMAMRYGSPAWLMPRLPA